MLLRLLLVLAIVCSAISVTRPAVAQEQRCTDLGTACICSESMNVSTFTSPDGNFFFGFPNANPKKCVYLNIAGAVGAVGSAGALSQFLMRSDATTINALTGTGNPQFVFGGQNGHTGDLQLAHTPFTGGAIVRAGLRWYRYYSPTFQFGSGSGACNNSGKEVEWQLAGGVTTTLGLVVTVSQSETGWSMYGLGENFSPTSLCCYYYGPGASPAAYGTNWAAHQGRWLRYELIVTNYQQGTPGMQFQLYAIDVTRTLPMAQRLNAGVEMTLIDSRVTCTTAPFPTGCDQGGSGWTSQMVNSFTPQQGLTDIHISGFRRDTCTGFAAYSYMLGARWTTNANQRIGAATEIEGGGSPPPTPPTAPCCLTATSTAASTATALLALATLTYLRRRRAP